MSETQTFPTPDSFVAEAVAAAELYDRAKADRLAF